MARKRRPAALLALILPLALWALSGLSTPARFEALGGATAQRDPDPIIQEILNQVTAAEISDLDGGISGEHPVMVGGNEVTFTSRYTPSSQGVLAEQYVYEYFQSLGLATSYHSWTTCGGITGRNVVAEIPGTVDPSRIYLITSHLDTISPNPSTNAKGADDNGTGTVAVMMAARILRAYSFDYTLRFVTFTGEERGLCGSNRYAYDARQSNADIRGVINLDMIGFDSNSVKDVEIHAGTRADSQVIGNMFISNISTYGLNLVPHLLTTSATTRSDHASFWTYSYPAMLGIEYFFGGDGNPWYHSYTCCDTMSHVDLGMATDMTKAAFATVCMLAGVHPFTPVTPTEVPTNTPFPQPTDTPVPQPTDTPVAPTDTPVPQPTDTAVPPTPCAVAFLDILPTDYFYEAVRYLACVGAVSGYGDGTFRPYNLTTRGQLSKIIVLAQGWSLYTPEVPTFRDVPADSPFYQYIETAYNHGIISGYNCGNGCLEFRPGNNVTRGQLCKIVVLAKGWPLVCPTAPTFVDVPPSDPFYCYVETALVHGIISGYNCGNGCVQFRSGLNATRGQISKIVYLAVTQP